MADTARIRVNVEVVTLEVNDNGDTVVLPVSDERFIQKLYDFVNRISDEAKKTESVNSEDIGAVIKADIELHSFIKTEFDELFGENAYGKVFGDDIVVGAEYVLEFIEQCLPYIEKHSSKRAQKFNKYSANRVGSSL